jgi:hypothetical protein
MPRKSTSKNKLYHIGPAIPDKFIYMLQGNDKGASQILTIPITFIDEKYYYTKRKRYRITNENWGYGQLFDWKWWTTDQRKVHERRLEQAKHDIEANEGYIDFMKYSRKRDFNYLLQDIRKAWDVEDIAREEKQKIYAKFKLRYEKGIHRLKAINRKLKKIIAKLEGESYD